MSKYTTEVRFICETAAGLQASAGLTSLDEILEAGRESIFDFDYPIFDAEYKPVLETKILKHFYTREIGSETVALWKLRLNSRLNEIMPYYNQLYKSELLAFNPLWDTDYTRTGDRSGNQSREENAASTTSRDGFISGSSEDTRNTAENSTDYMSGKRKEGGTESRTLSSNSVENSTGNRDTKHTGEDTETTGRDNINDRWDYYSDTPQGTIGFIPGSTGEPQAQGDLANQTYLTNVRHIHDDTTGSEESKTRVRPRYKRNRYRKPEYGQQRERYPGPGYDREHGTERNKGPESRGNRHAVFPEY